MTCFGLCIRDETSFLQTAPSGVMCGYFNESKGYAVVGYSGGTLRIWSISEKKVLRSFPGHESRVSSAAMSADRKRVVSGSLDKSVRVWDVETGVQIGDAFTGHTKEVNSVATSADGKRMVSGSSDNSVRVLGRGKGESWR